MKKIFYSLLVSIIFLTSCKKFLETTPTDSLSPVNYYRTEAEVNTALTGVYDILGKSGTYGRNLFFEMDQADDSFVALSTWTQDVALYNYSTGDVKLTSTWTLLYDGINRANALIENVDKASMSEAAKDVVRGQALFLRAYYYFLLVSNWGDVPLRLKATASVSEVNFKRTPYKIVYQQIVADMETAANLVNPASAYTYNSRITKSVVWGILARVNLKMAGAPLRDATRFAEAKKWALMVMSAGHSLNTDYKQVFINMCKDVYDTKEVLWEVEFGKKATSQDEEGNLGSINGIGTSNTTVGFSYGAKHTTATYYNSFAAGDLRRDWNINPYYYTSVTDATKVNYSTSSIYNRCDAKWRREYETATPKFNGSTPINFPLLRYSDVLLMYAEAENEINGATTSAYDAINTVRRRAYGVTLGLSTNAIADLTPNLDNIAFGQAVRSERSWELGYEGLRRFDLIRWGAFVTTMKNIANVIATTAPSAYTYGAKSGQNVSDRDTLFAIPSKELSLNHDAVQNKGW